jgi:hypothetical protein
MIPLTYEQWHHCITVKCGISLSREFVERRICELSDDGNRDTQKFVQLYGDGQRQFTLRWFNQALNTLL